MRLSLGGVVRAAGGCEGVVAPHGAAHGSAPGGDRGASSGYQSPHPHTPPHTHLFHPLPHGRCSVVLDGGQANMWGECAKILLERGADPNCYDARGRTGLLLVVDLLSEGGKKKVEVHVASFASCVIIVRVSSDLCHLA